MLEVKTKIIKVSQDLINEPAISEAAMLLRAGQVVAFPTETVYGLGADATSKDAVELIYKVKNRPADNPLIVHIEDINQLKSISVCEDPRIRLLSVGFWPGPLTLILPAKDPLKNAASRGLDTVAVRMPSHPVARALIRLSELPVAAPSANLSGRPSPTTAEHVFEDLKGRIPLIIDGGECQIGIESTVLDLTTPKPLILRPGRVTKEELEHVLDQEVLLANNDTLRSLPRSPGTRYRHYSPSSPVFVVGQNVSDTILNKSIRSLLNHSHQNTKFGYIGWRTVFSNYSNCVVKEIDKDRTDEFGRLIYRYLRELDDKSVAFMFVDAVPSKEFGVSVMDRLRRASTHIFQSDLELNSFILSQNKE